MLELHVKLQCPKHGELAAMEKPARQLSLAGVSETPGNLVLLIVDEK